MASFSALIALLICLSVIHVRSEGNCTNEVLSSHKRKTATLLQKEASARQGSTVEGGRALLSRRAGKDDMSNAITTEDFVLNGNTGMYRQYQHELSNKCCVPGTTALVYLSAKSWQTCAQECVVASGRSHVCYNAKAAADSAIACGCFKSKSCDSFSKAWNFNYYAPTGVEFTQAQWEAWYTEAGFYAVHRTRPYAYSCNANNECNKIVLQGENGATNTFYSEGRRRRYKQYSVSGCQSSTAAAEGNAGRRRRYSESSYTDQEGCSTVSVDDR